MNLFNDVQPAGGTPIGGCLKKATLKLAEEYEGKDKKANYLIITDGIPSKLPHSKPFEVR